MKCRPDQKCGSSATRPESRNTSRKSESNRNRQSARRGDLPGPPNNLDYEPRTDRRKYLRNIGNASLGSSWRCSPRGSLSNSWASSERDAVTMPPLDRPKGTTAARRARLPGPAAAGGSERALALQASRRPMAWAGKPPADNAAREWTAPAFPVSDGRRCAHPARSGPDGCASDSLVMRREAAGVEAYPDL